MTCIRWAAWVISPLPAVFLQPGDGAGSDLRAPATEGHPAARSASGSSRARVRLAGWSDGAARGGPAGFRRGGRESAGDRPPDRAGHQGGFFPTRGSIGSGRGSDRRGGGNKTGPIRFLNFADPHRGDLALVFLLKDAPPNLLLSGGPASSEKPCGCAARSARSRARRSWWGVPSRS